MVCFGASAAAAAEGCNLQPGPKSKVTLRAKQSLKRKAVLSIERVELRSPSLDTFQCSHKEQKRREEDYHWQGPRLTCKSRFLRLPSQKASLQLLRISMAFTWQTNSSRVFLSKGTCLVSFVSWRIWMETNATNSSAFIIVLSRFLYRNFRTPNTLNTQQEHKPCRYRPETHSPNSSLIEYSENSPSQASTICELWTSRCSSYF